MVSTRGIKYKYCEGERVLCYEPDPSKAKVLYDSKVLEVSETKDKRGRRVVEYLIHFQGWNSSWDRRVVEEFVLKDIDENRQLQKDLAEKSQLQLGAYLYRKDRRGWNRNRTSQSSESKMPNRGSSDDSNSCNTIEKDDADYQQIEDDSGSCSSSNASSTEDERIVMKVGERLQEFLEYDYKMITKCGKLLDLPVQMPVVTILENYVKHYAIKEICCPPEVHRPHRRRNSQAKTEKKGPDLEALTIQMNLCKEVADGLRLYFDFTLRNYLLYSQETEQARIILSDDNLKNFTYIASEQLSIDIVSVKQDTPDTPFGGDFFEYNAGAVSAAHDETNIRRKLRSHRSENTADIQYDLKPDVTGTMSSGSECSTPHTITHSLSGLPIQGAIRSVLPLTAAFSPKARELLQGVLMWRMLPSDAPPEASMVYGAVHLARLFIKLPEFLTATVMPEEKLKSLLIHLDGFIGFLEDHKDWFGEKFYKDAVPSVGTGTGTGAPDTSGLSQQ